MTTRTIELTEARVAAFWSKVDRRTPDACWEWIGQKQQAHGYGLYAEWSGNRQVLRFYAHRLSLLIAGQAIGGRVVRHDCDNPPCVNPSHLRVGAPVDNIHDAIERGRLNTSGLAIGQAAVWPPRPCWRCGVTVSEGRRRYCPPCRVIVTAENHARYQARRVAS